MGNNISSSSGGGGRSNEAAPICLDCDKKHQKELPASDPVSREGQPCASVYEHVSDCMTKHGGKISSCTQEWEAFRRCHQKEQNQERNIVGENKS
mmetsp:Transcript_6013/g.13043  ORF Transcript_6013/g.13043 Transcript_6013/m.13043 type:complete len:95 (-) Transcript_6013:539-823(-)